MKPKQTGQRGVALILTLGVLAILLAIGMAFIANVIIYRNTAAANTGRSISRTIAKSGMSRLLTNIMLYQLAYPAESDLTVANSKNYPTAGDTDGIEVDENYTLLDIVINNVRYTPTTSRQPEWIYVYDDDPAATIRPIIGRYAFMILPLPGQISFSEALRGHSSRQGKWAERLGVDMKELNIGARTGTGFAGHLTTLASGWGGANDFSDYESILSAFSPTFDVADQTWIRNHFAPGGLSEAENWAYDPAADIAAGTFSDDAKYYHRFNLARDDWDTLASNNGVEILLGEGGQIEEFKVDATETPKSSGIQFLRMIGSDAGAYPSLELRRRQIAANLINYCAGTATVPVSDSADWWTNPPNYTGNAKTLYLNEVSFGLSVVVERQDTPASPPDVLQPFADLEITVNLDRVYAELINMYTDPGTTLPGHQVKMLAKMDVEVLLGGSSLGTFSYPSTELTIDAGSVDRGYGVFSRSGNAGSPLFLFGTFFKRVDDPTEEKCKVEAKVVSLTVEKIYLSRSANEPADFTSSLVSTGGKSVVSVTPPADSIEEGYGLVGFSVDDPRENLYQGSDAGGHDYKNWEIYALDLGSNDPNSSDFSANPTVGDVTLGARNRNCNPAGAGDAESGATEPWDVSTAFIANRPMKSPLELGAIHRGAKWETINLKKATDTFSHVTKYNPSAGLNTAGTEYADGDGGILDQIKMTDRLFDSAKVNLNDRLAAADTDSTDMVDIFKALIHHVKVEDVALSDAMNDSGTELDAAASSIPGRLLRKSGSTTRVLSRSELLYEDAADVAGFYSDGFGELASLSSDAEKEALVGKTICLLTAKTPPPSYMQAVIIAQAIKDVGGVTINKYDSSNALQSRATTIGTFDYEYGLYFDEIIGEMKLLVVIDNGGVTPNTLRVIRQEFLD